jgi:hypothetical protein
MGKRILVGLFLLGMLMLARQPAQAQLADQWVTANFLKNWDRGGEDVRAGLRQFLNGMIVGITETQGHYQVYWQAMPLFCPISPVTPELAIKIIQRRVFFLPDSVRDPVVNTLTFGLGDTFPCHKK